MSHPFQILHVFIGTKAQYIKTAPLLRLMDERGVGYRLIDSGQHARISAALRQELRIRDPDLLLGDQRDVNSIPQAAGWSLRIACRLWSGRRIRDQIFGGAGGICVVHGDTPSTVLSVLLARRAGLRVAHLEAGLRSYQLLHPLPEELIRIIVMRLSHVLFAPDEVAVRNLKRMHIRGRVVALPGNTSLEALRFSLNPTAAPGKGPVIATMHRVENLHRPRRTAGFIQLLKQVAADHPVQFVTHGPTIETIRALDAEPGLRSAGVKLVPLLPHRAFTSLLQAAPFVITDGGSIQEECALLGVPTLLWRDRSERPDGLGANVVLSHYDPAVVGQFLASPAQYRHAPRDPDERPSQVILDELLGELRERC